VFVLYAYLRNAVGIDLTCTVTTCQKKTHIVSVSIRELTKSQGNVGKNLVRKNCLLLTISI